jgi:hypothetical protein
MRWLCHGRVSAPLPYTKRLQFPLPQGARLDGGEMVTRQATGGQDLPGKVQGQPHGRGHAPCLGTANQNVPIHHITFAPVEPYPPASARR